MKALTVKQPHASLIIGGLKPVENRTWPVPSTLPQWVRCDGCGFRAQGPAAFGGDYCIQCGGVGVLDGPFPFRLWIHAGARYDRTANIWRRVADATGLWDWRDWAADALPAGAIVGSVDVTGCHHGDECEHFAPTGETLHGATVYRSAWCSRWAEPDRWHWTLADPQPLAEPIPMRGRQGLWTVPDDALAAVQP